MANAADKPTAQHPPAPLATPTDLGDNARRDIAGAVNALLADSFALYLKTKNFHWHVSGPHFRDYHLLLDEQAAQIFATTDPLAERVRKLGGTTLRSIGDVARHQRVLDNDAEYVEPRDMLAELRDDNRADGGADAAGARGLRRARRRGDREPARDLHRRGRAPRLVPLRGQPRRQAGVENENGRAGRCRPPGAAALSPRRGGLECGTPNVESAPMAVEPLPSDVRLARLEEAVVGMRHSIGVMQWAGSVALGAVTLIVVALLTRSFILSDQITALTGQVAAQNEKVGAVQQVLGERITGVQQIWASGSPTSTTGFPASSRIPSRSRPTSARPTTT